MATQGPSTITFSETEGKAYWNLMLKLVKTPMSKSQILPLLNNNETAYNRFLIFKEHNTENLRAYLIKLQHQQKLQAELEQNRTKIQQLQFEQHKLTQQGNDAEQRIEASRDNALRSIKNHI